MNEETVFTPSDREYMQRALRLARQAEGRTGPNPMVGCVIVRDGEIVGEGFHHKAGTPHAELHALAAAENRAQGATAYVTLEPCSHYGRTPPCADALIRAGLQKVVIAMPDPNPLVAGRGIERLLEAGLDVKVGLMADEAGRLNEVFLKSIVTGLPFVTYKSALTLDGRISTESGDSRWVSSPQSREASQRLRNLADVIMVGSGTVRQDNPRLTCRLPGGRDPVRLVVDGTLSLPEDAQVLSSSPSAPCIIATTAAASRDKAERLRRLRAVEVWLYETSRYVPLETLLRDLAARGWTAVLLEGGGGLAGQLLTGGLLDKIEFFLAPKFVGGNGPSPFSGFTAARMSDAVHLTGIEVSRETGDIHVTGYVSNRREHFPPGNPLF
ncbi:diaminohydroxyphosphoribosylaminopyrimidine deaminase/glucuronate reductase [Acididesulfobacillus acetoxydans]|uniref:Riboflavin biosynthesis protein RibD n=1 Tax=Acididesulfobacillus acetoxydans TaxID=1561005 RepID=A0A8S0WPC9_9FIRM|nr:bifunctional diaminohydroxyphosphoribosylaminopyrimidine deaminase/5-amino-6-(5-phosphoribosylamino)uracil reductase RibD [Acididesulfobacillus acetoxydans]CAA7601834.1 diaminohydroxyphosphoribosylaminopyrimidine deaminase/glucuronate reductase [Acididesulfobacillus acetoxydans]CEJ09350.1 Riboflavin biosynthesis protein RibD [Acididesulfobacillus acetoxydans]